jgi:hypothetical protein
MREWTGTATEMPANELQGNIAKIGKIFFLGRVGEISAQTGSLVDVP